MSVGISSRILTSVLILQAFWDITVAPESTKCTNCVARRDEIARARIENIKATILKNLGLKAPPRVHLSPKIKPTIEKIARMAEHEAQAEAAQAEEETEPKTEIIMFGQESLDGFNGDRVIDFHISSGLKFREVLGGALKMQIHHPSSHRYSNRHAELDCSVAELSENDEADVIAHQKQNLHEALDDYAKIPLDSGDLQRWISNGETVSFVIRAQYKNEDLFIYPTANDSYTVFLELVTVERKLRQKRSSHHDVCDARMKIKKCCRYDLIVDFAEVGWDFVQFPPTYNAFMCLGECQSFDQNRNAYSMVASKTKENVAGCCHPSEYESLDMTYFTEEKILVRTKMPNLVAKSCMCA